MTPEMALRLRTGKSVIPSSAVCLPSVAQVAPKTKTSLLVPDSPRDLPDSAFNGLTNNDVLFLQQSKQSDHLHRSDVLAKEINRGAKLTQWIQKHGVEKFKQVHGYHE